MGKPRNPKSVWKIARFSKNALESEGAIRMGPDLKANCRPDIRYCSIGSNLLSQMRQEREKAVAPD